MRARRGPDVSGRRRIAERRRHDANNRAAGAAERERAAEDGRIGAEATPPERVADDDDRRAAEPFFLRRRETAERRCDAQHLEEPRRRVHRGHALRHRARGVRDVFEIAGAKRLERAVLRVPLFEPARRDQLRRLTEAGVPFVDRHQPIRGRVGQRLQQNRVDGGEDGAVRADPERERAHDHRRQPPAMGQGSKGGPPWMEHACLTA